MSLPTNTGFLSLYSYAVNMSVDFKIISNTAVPGISLVMPMTEDAYDYIESECDMNVMDAGCAPIYSEDVGDFISDAGWSKFTSELV